ncbi:hypothetical protein ACLOJK_040734 [Asimina triloba]
MISNSVVSLEAILNLSISSFEKRNQCWLSRTSVWRCWQCATLPATICGSRWQQQAQAVKADEAGGSGHGRTRRRGRQRGMALGAAAGADDVGHDGWPRSPDPEAFRG